MGYELYFGSGGGATGEINAYCLLDNGRLYHRPTKTGEFFLVDRIPKRRRNDLFWQVDNLDLFGVQFLEHENRFRFLQIKGQEGVNRVMWGDRTASQLPDGITDLYKELQVIAAESRD
ncbi:hypothetical protein [Pontibacter sp. G13]|uniref:hypothetical protein n=1 Tax=Pontibacter sp. G13 TaxID=3074898 RepID=UPI00288B1495|nr:hypothetical protein [Pontibacter sp. G13]WNJ20772.1 hypothetical protein RJD25_09840 [Pontibacter sp. G13]